MSPKIPVAISFNEVASFLRVVGIIGSLIFVGLELQQTQNNARKQASGAYGRIGRVNV
jgi:hypothetical protein|tara:strand:- start:357 stop:530 length:174 start_codon:yes stop_codon:yes gene_type:complete